MSIQSTLNRKIEEGFTSNVAGKWQAIKFCPDIATDEWLNVGVYFQSNAGSRYVKMLDDFDRIKCLYDNRIAEDDLLILLEKMEEALRFGGADKLNEIFYPYGQINELLFAAGDSVDSIVSNFYESVVTLGRPRKNKLAERFRWVTTPSLRSAIFDHMRKENPMMASSVIQERPFIVNFIAGVSLETSINLVGPSALGHITSAYNKNPVVVANHIMQATHELNLAKNHTAARSTTLSVLAPGVDSGLSKSELKKVQEAIEKQLKFADLLNIEVILGETVESVAKATTDRWNDLVAA